MRADRNGRKPRALFRIPAAVCLVIVAPVGVRCQSATPTQHTSLIGFVGSRACAGCHAGIFQRQEASNHALSLRAPADIAELYQSLPFQFEDKSSKTLLTLRKSADNQLELDAGQGGQQAALKLRWAFGSARRGVTPLGMREDGTIVESRLSWFPFDGGYSLTPGATRYDPQGVVESLGRAMTLEDVQQCFSCHTTDYTPTPQGPMLSEMGIHCERCHGPGLEHTRVMSSRDPPASGQDRKILNPARLKTFAQLEMCGACHGRPPLDTDLAALQYLERTPQTARYPSRRLVLSRCYNESADGLKCTLCHDPHGNVQQQRSQRDQACIHCHDEGLRSKARVCPVNKTDCVSCHMPRQRVMIHSEFTDHWIRVAARTRPEVPGEPRLSKSLRAGDAVVFRRGSGSCPLKARSFLGRRSHSSRITSRRPRARKLFGNSIRPSSNTNSS